MLVNMQRPPVPPEIWQSPWYFIAFGFGSGAFPVAPGTAGTVMAIPFYLLFAHLGWFSYVSVVVGCMLFSIWLLDDLSAAIRVHDHPGMCLDEFIGYFVTMAMVQPTLSNILLGCVLFRVFDIWKPWPISWIDRNCLGGVGMVLDDIAAGMIAMIILWLLS